MPIHSNLLYGAYNIRATVVNPDGSERQSGWGTCFGLRLNEELTVFPTARHVVDPAFLDSSFVGTKLVEIEVRGRHLMDGEPTGYFSSTWHNFGVCWPSDSVSDIAVVYGPKTKDGVPIRIDTYTKDSVPPKHILSGLSIAANLGAAGYPEHHDQLDLRPLLRSGRVASDPRYAHAILRGNGVQQRCGQIVAYDGFSWGGLSGAPVWWQVSDQIVFLAGINAGHMDTWISNRTIAHSGLSYFYRIDVLAELLNALLHTKQWTLPYPSYPVSTTFMGMEVSLTQPYPLQEVTVPAITP